MKSARIGSCVFCDRIEAGEFEPTIDDRVVTFEPLNPVTDGHLLFVPRKHAFDPGEDPASLGHAMTLAAAWGGDGTDAFNLIASAGQDATQTVFHTHVHFVPRHAEDGLHLPWTGQAAREAGRPSARPPAGPPTSPVVAAGSGGEEGL